MPLSLNIGDTVELKKQHACGCKEFEIIRVGMDIKIKCKNVLTNNNKSVIITPSKETRKRIKQSKKFIQFIAYINVPMKRMKIKERFG